MSGIAKHVVIVGGGFAGLEAAKILARDERIHLTIIDSNNYHLFQPLLYQVATAALSPAEIAMPIRAVLRSRPNTLVIMASVKSIDRDQSKVILEDDRAISFDYLILATGMTNSYFGHSDWEKYAPGLKSLEDAIEIRKRILTAFEKAEQTSDPKLRDAFLTFVVVGGGPTGLELAGAISEIARYSVARDFVNIRPALAKIYLIEAGDALLSTFHPEIWDKAKDAVEKLGVEVLLKTRVTGIDADGVVLNDKRIEAKIILWAAGVKPSPLTTQLGCDLDRGGRVLVREDLTTSNAENIFVTGDIAAVRWYDGKFVPAMAPGAMQQGRHAARSILRDLAGKPREKFTFKDKGSMATIGRASAVCDLGPMRISGFIAWLIWIFVHVFYLIGFRNRMLVLIQWAWSYLTFQRGTRLITHVDQRSRHRVEPSAASASK